MVADGRHAGYQQRSAPGVQLVEAQTARLLTLVQGARSDVPATDNNLVTILQCVLDNRVFPVVAKTMKILSNCNNKITIIRLKSRAITHFDINSV